MPHSAGDNATERGIAIKNGRPNIRKFDNGFVMEDTSMGPPDGKVCPSSTLTSCRTVLYFPQEDGDFSAVT